MCRSQRVQKQKRGQGIVEFESLIIVFCSSLLVIWLLAPFLVRYWEKRSDFPWVFPQVMIIRRNRPGWPHYNNGLPLGSNFDGWVLLTCEDQSEGKVNAELIGTFPTKRDAMKAREEKFGQLLMGLRLLLTEYLGDHTYVNTLTPVELVSEFLDQYRYGLSSYIEEKNRRRGAYGEKTALSVVSDSESDSSEETLDGTLEEAQKDQNSDDADYHSMTVADLKQLLKERGLPASGKKFDLISRLLE